MTEGSTPSIPWEDLHPDVCALTLLGPCLVCDDADLEYLLDAGGVGETSWVREWLKGEAPRIWALLGAVRLGSYLRGPSLPEEADPEWPELRAKVWQAARVDALASYGDPQIVAYAWGIEDLAGLKRELQKAIAEGWLLDPACIRLSPMGRDLVMSLQHARDLADRERAIRDPGKIKELCKLDAQEALQLASKQRVDPALLLAEATRGLAVPRAVPEDPAARGVPAGEHPWVARRRERELQREAKRKR